MLRRRVLGVTVCLLAVGVIQPLSAHAASPASSLGPVSITASLNDIFNAGHPVPPLGDGKPVRVPLPAGSAGKAIEVSNAIGGVTQGVNPSSTSPDGGYDPDLAMNINSFDGISGIKADPGLGGFLAGVFTSDSEPTGDGPTRLDYTAAANEFTTTQSVYQPVPNQLFFIGDGLTGTGTGQEQQFIVPAGATTLWLGVADAGFYQGDPIPTTGNTGGFTANLSLVPATLTLDAGTFIGISYKGGTSGLECTTAFGAHDSNGVGFVVGAKHCADGRDGNQRNNNKLAKHSPLRINFFNAITGTVGAQLAAADSCGQQSTKTCLVPAPDGQTGDFFAWRPDNAAVSSRVQTGSSPAPLPVLGSEPVSAIVPDKTVICHYGAGSAKDFKQAEECNTIFSAAEQKKFCKTVTNCDSDVVFGPIIGSEGDSGGPVYQYNGLKTGVIAVGIEIVTTDYCAKNMCVTVSGFVPIDHALVRLGLTLNTQTLNTQTLNT